MSENFPLHHLHTEFRELSDSILCNKHLRNLFDQIDGMIVNNNDNSISRAFTINSEEASLMPVVARLGYEIAMDRVQNEKTPAEGGGVVHPPAGIIRNNQFSGLIEA